MKLLLKISILIAGILTIEYLWGWGNIVEQACDFAKTNNNPFLFLSIMGIGCAVGFPLSLAYLFAGAAFGVFLGWGICLLGLLISASIGFLFGRFFASEKLIEKIENKFGKFSGETFYNANFFVRAIPGIPYWLQNVFLGAIKTDFLLYTIINLAVQGSIAFAMNFLSANINEDGFVKYVAIIVLIIVIAVMHRFLKKFCLKNN